MTALAVRIPHSPACESWSPSVLLAKLARAVTITVRAGALLLLYPVAIADIMHVRLVTTPTGTALAHARASWLHRWCRVIKWMLGLKIARHSFTPVSGIVIANRPSLLEAIVLAATHRCVLVAGIQVRTWPLIGLLARLGGTIFIDRTRRGDLARVNFMIQRSLRRRLLVVIFPGCDRSQTNASRGTASGLLQSAEEVGCTLTVATLCSDHGNSEEGIPSCIDTDSFPRHAIHLLAHAGRRIALTFSLPAYRAGNRKALARELLGEAMRLEGRQAPAAS